MSYIWEIASLIGITFAILLTTYIVVSISADPDKSYCRLTDNQDTKFCEIYFEKLRLDVKKMHQDLYQPRLME